jgi:hypothetical protein
MTSLIVWSALASFFAGITCGVGLMMMVDAYHVERERIEKRNSLDRAMCEYEERYGSP